MGDVFHLELEGGGLGGGRGAAVGVARDAFGGFEVEGGPGNAGGGLVGAEEPVGEVGGFIKIHVIGFIGFGGVRGDQVEVFL